MWNALIGGAFDELADHRWKSGGGILGQLHVARFRDQQHLGRFKIQPDRPQRDLVLDVQIRRERFRLLAGSDERSGDDQQNCDSTHRYVPPAFFNAVAFAAGAITGFVVIPMRLSYSVLYRCTARVNASTMLFWNSSFFSFDSSSGFEMNATSTSAAGIVAPTRTLNGACFTPRFCTAVTLFISS